MILTKNHRNCINQETEFFFSDTGNGEQLYECPMCSLTCTNIQILEEHVDLHLEEHNFSEGT